MKKIATRLFQAVIPVVLVTFFIMQIISSQNGNLTPWKGGGFGMYSEIHWANNQIWVGTRTEMIAGGDIKDLLTGSNKRYIGKIKRNPSDENLKKFSEILSHDTEIDEFILQIWKPQLETNSTHYKRIKINEIYFKR